MEFGLARFWWILALRGVLAILFGVLAFLWPGLLWLVVVATFAVYALIDGVLAIMAAVSTHGHGERWWALLLEGLVGITAGVLAIALPGITQLALLYLIAGWLIATGVFEIIAAIRLRQYIQGEWLLALSGVLSIILGLVLGIAPLEGLVVVAWMIGVYAVAFGVLMLVLALRLRSLARHAYRPGGRVAMT
jgi:uncharacterized membrane protein HdeD (DUF308 family)